MREVLDAVHEQRLGVLRCLKAAAEFGQNAGQQIAAARTIVGDEGWRNWIASATALSLREAEALERFHRGLNGRRLDLSPTSSATLEQVLPLVALLADSMNDAAEAVTAESRPLDAAACTERDGAAIAEPTRDRQESPTAAQPDRSAESGPDVPDLSAMPESQAAAHAAVILDELDGAAGDGSPGDDAKAAVREKVLAGVDRLFVRYARSLRQQRPDVFERVLRGDLSVPDALRLAESTPRRRSRR